MRVNCFCWKPIDKITEEEKRGNRIDLWIEPPILRDHRIYFVKNAEARREANCRISGTAWLSAEGKNLEGKWTLEDGDLVLHPNDRSDAAFKVTYYMLVMRPL